MINPDNQNPRSDNPLQETNEQVDGHELKIGERLRGIITSGISLMLSGIVLLILSMLVGIFWPGRKAYGNALRDFCINVGVASIASGVVVVTVERSSDKQRSKQSQLLVNEIDKYIKKKLDYLTMSIEEQKMFAGIQNENISTQVKNHILYQDFIIKKYQVTILLNWCNQGKIKVEASIKYDVQNISGSDKSYPINVFVYNNALDSHLMPKISKYYVNQKDYLSSNLTIDIEKQRQEVQPYIGFEDNILTEPNVPTKIEIGFIAYRDENDQEPFLVPQITDIMTLRIIYWPQNIDVFCVPLHPQEDSYEKPRDRHELEQVWKIKTGLFP